MLRLPNGRRSVVLHFCVCAASGGPEIAVPSSDSSAFAVAQRLSCLYGRQRRRPEDRLQPRATSPPTPGRCCRDAATGFPGHRHEFRGRARRRGPARMGGGQKAGGPGGGRRRTPGAKAPMNSRLRSRKKQIGRGGMGDPADAAGAAFSPGMARGSPTFDWETVQICAKPRRSCAALQPGSRPRTRRAGGPRRRVGPPTGLWA